MEFLTEELKQHLTQNERATYEILEEAYNTDELTEESKKVLENLNRTAQERAGIIKAVDSDVTAETFEISDLLNVFEEGYLNGKYTCIQETLEEYKHKLNSNTVKVFKEFLKCTTEYMALDEVQKLFSEITEDLPDFFGKSEDIYVKELAEKARHIHTEDKNVLMKAFFLKELHNAPKDTENLMERMYQAIEQFENRQEVTDKEMLTLLCRSFAFEILTIRNLALNYVMSDTTDELTGVTETLNTLIMLNYIYCIRTVTGHNKPITKDELDIGFKLMSRSVDISKDIFDYKMDQIIDKNKAQKQILEKVKNLMNKQDEFDEFEA